MIINKYNSAKGNLSTRAGVSTGSISSDSSSSSGGVSIDRVLWGQNDDGEDIDGSMWINGSLYLGEIDYGSEDDEETTTDTNEIFVDDETGTTYTPSGDYASYKKKVTKFFKSNQDNLILLFKFSINISLE